MVEKIRKELIEFLKECQKRNIPLSIAKQKLMEKGWPEEEINLAIESLTKKSLTKIDVPVLKIKKEKKKRIISLIKYYGNFYFHPIKNFELEKNNATWKGVFKNIFNTIWPLILSSLLAFIFLFGGTIFFDTTRKALAMILPYLPLIFGALILGIIVVYFISFFLAEGVIYISSKILKGKGDFKTQCYLGSLILPFHAFITAGIIIVSSIFYLIPFVGFIIGYLTYYLLAIIVLFPLSAWMIILTVIYLKVTHNYSWVRAALSLIIPFIVIMIIIVGILTAVLIIKIQEGGGLPEEILVPSEFKLIRSSGSFKVYEYIGPSKTIEVCNFYESYALSEHLPYEIKTKDDTKCKIEIKGKFYIIADYDRYSNKNTLSIYLI